MIQFDVIRFSTMLFNSEIQIDPGKFSTMQASRKQSNLLSSEQFKENTNKTQKQSNKFYSFHKTIPPCISLEAVI